LHWHFNYRCEKINKYELQNFHFPSDSGENQIKNDEFGEIWHSWECETIFRETSEKFKPGRTSSKWGRNFKIGLRHIRWEDGGRCFLIHDTV